MRIGRSYAHEAKESVNAREVRRGYIDSRRKDSWGAQGVTHVDVPLDIEIGPLRSCRADAYVSRYYYRTGIQGPSRDQS